MRPGSPPDREPSAAVCGTCLTPLDSKSKSPDFCSASCQDLWHKSQADPIAWTMSLPADDHVLSERIKSRLGLADSGRDVA